MSLRITTTEMHTGGEPVRIVESGYPRLTGGTILDKRRRAREEFDHIRTFLMHEPRGHRDMYGVVFVEPDHPEADMAVLFTHNEGYSFMCGHATIALGRYAVDRGVVPMVEPETVVHIQAPCGLVTARVEVVGGVSGRVTFTSVGAYAHALDQRTEVPGHGSVGFDVGYGGAFYAILPANELGVTLDAPVRDLVSAAAALTDHLRATTDIRHPDEAGIGGVYGSILTDGSDQTGRPSRNVCVFAKGQLDRSPTGSGVTARMALLHARGTVEHGEERVFQSLTGSRMTGRVSGSARIGGVDGVTVDVSGYAYYTGSGDFELEAGDPLGHGFLLD